MLQLENSCGLGVHSFLSAGSPSAGCRQLCPPLRPLPQLPPLQLRVAAVCDPCPVQTAPPVLRPLPQSGFLSRESQCRGAPSSALSHWQVPSGCSPLPLGPPSMGQSSCLMSQLWAAGCSCPPSAHSACRQGHCSRMCLVGSWGSTKVAQDQSGPREGGAEPSRVLRPPALGSGGL